MNLETIGLAAVCALPLGLTLLGEQEGPTPSTPGSQVEGLREDLAELERRIAEVRAARVTEERATEERAAAVVVRGLRTQAPGAPTDDAPEQPAADLERARTELEQAQAELERARAELERTRTLAAAGQLPTSALVDAERALVQARAGVDGRDLGAQKVEWAVQDLERLRALADAGLISLDEVVAAERALERARAALEGRDLAPQAVEWAAQDLARLRSRAESGLIAVDEVRAAERALVEARAAAERAAAERAAARHEERVIEVRVRGGSDAGAADAAAPSDEPSLSARLERLLAAEEELRGSGTDATRPAERVRLFVLDEHGELRELEPGAGTPPGFGARIGRVTQLDEQLLETLGRVRRSRDGAPVEVQVEVEVGAQGETDEQLVEIEQLVELEQLVEIEELVELEELVEVEVGRVGTGSAGSAPDVIVGRRSPSADGGERRIRFEPLVTAGPDGERRVVGLRRTTDGWTEVEGQALGGTPEGPRRFEVRGLSGGEPSVQVFELPAPGVAPAEQAWSPGDGPDAGPRQWVFHGDDGRVLFGRATPDGTRIEFEKLRIEGFGARLEDRGRTAPQNGRGEPDGSPFDHGAPRAVGPDRGAPAPQVWFVDRDGNEFRGPGAPPPVFGRRSGGPEGDARRGWAPGLEGDRGLDRRRGPDEPSALDREFAELLRELNDELRAVREELAALRRTMDGR